MLEDTVNGKIKQEVMTAKNEQALANVIGRDWVTWWRGDTNFDRKGLSEEMIFE